MRRLPADQLRQRITRSRERRLLTLTVLLLLLEHLHLHSGVPALVDQILRRLRTFHRCLVVVLSRESGESHPVSSCSSVKAHWLPCT